MAGRRRWLISIAPLCLLALLGLAVFAQQRSSGGQYPSSLLAGFEWRDVGPMRGGRTFGVAGHANQPDTFYFGSVGGGVWKTENAGTVRMHTFRADLLLAQRVFRRDVACGTVQADIAVVLERTLKTP